MSLKIFHIADVHIGKKFSRYPADISDDLIEARFISLKNAIEEANKRECDLFIIAGDLFETLKVSQKDIDKVIDIINAFRGLYLFILPGNHDYYEEALTFWNKIENKKADNVIVLKEAVRKIIEVGEMNLAIFPAPCDAKHSETNRIAWIKNEELSKNHLNILIAHGALKEISPDLNNIYFPMDIKGIDSLGMDLALLGHTHVPYPMQSKTSNNHIFNPGTTEPDGMDYAYDGAGWFLEVDQDKNISAERVILGNYRFADEKIEIDNILDPARIKKSYEIYDPCRLLLRLSFSGYIDKESYESRNDIFNELKQHFYYFYPEDKDLKVKFKAEMIKEEFVDGSLPFVFLNNLLEETDEDTTHLAYELLMEVKKND